MQTKSELAKKRQIYSWVRFTPLAVVGVFLSISRGLPDTSGPWPQILYSAVLAIAIGGSIYASTLKRQIRQLEYEELGSAITNASMTAPQAGSPQSTETGQAPSTSPAMSRGAKALAGKKHDAPQPAAAVAPVAPTQIPQSMDLTIRSLTTEEQVRQAFDKATSMRTRFSLAATTCTVLGSISGLCAFVLPMQACSIVLHNGVQGTADAINAFFSTLVTCVVIGVVFAAVAAVLRSRARAQENRIHELNLQGMRVQATQTPR